MRSSVQKQSSKEQLRQEQPRQQEIPVVTGGMSHSAAAMLFRSRGRIATVIMLALSLLIGYFVIFDHDGLAAYEQKKHEAQQLQQQIQSMQQDNLRMAAHNKRLKSDPDTIEHQAREQLHYTRPGEVIYTLPAAPGASTTPSQSAK
ncbi:MAG TPA: septum formation initiator family protein [Acidobacteriaceae bacterium]|nr:septum formation initiator family protein [Acidobacteriaceae bacterium]